MYLFLLKYWTLYNSLLNSKTTLPRIKSWHFSGQQNIKRLIAKLGVPLVDAKEKYEFLSPAFKETLKEKMLEIEDGQFSVDLLVTSFIYVLDNRSSFTSFDLAHIIEAVLNSRQDINQTVLGLESHVEKIDNKAIEQENFWVAYNKILDL